MKKIIMTFLAAAYHWLHQLNKRSCLAGSRNTQDNQCKNKNTRYKG